MTATERVVDLPFSIAPPLPHIREYRESDAEAVARMWRESASAWPGGGPGGGEHATASRVRQDQRDISTLATFIAWAPDPDGGSGHNGRGERAVGYCSLFELPSDASAAYVGTLSAHPQWHGQGVGRDLLKAALVRTVALGFARLDLHTWAGNLKAVPLYKKSGYFWVPDTSVRMENYLPLIFRLPPAQRFFEEADWYRDFRRDLSLRPDEEKRDKLDVFTYVWERGERRLRVAIDRTSKGVVSLETERYAVDVTIDDPRLPVGGTRSVRWRVSQAGASASDTADSQPLAVSLLAEGEDSVRCTLQSSAMVEGEREWTAPVTAEQPPPSPPVGRPTNRVRSTVVIAGEAIPLALGTQLVQPVEVVFDANRMGRRWFTPGSTQHITVGVENALDEAVRGTLRLVAPGAVTLEATAFDFALDARRKTTFPLSVRADATGAHTLRAQAVVHPSGNGAGAALRTTVFETSLLCGEPGELFVTQSESQVWVGTDRLSVSFPLQPTGNWTPSFAVRDRASGERILSHSVSVGPPFSPSPFAAAPWKAKVEREGGSVTVALAATPPALLGLTFERIVRISASGLLRVVYRALNAGSGERTLVVKAETGVSLDMIEGPTRVAAPLTGGLVVEESTRFPDWEEPELGQPARYAESWMAEFGEGWVGATLWQGAQEVFASWQTPSLTFALGEVAPGGQRETPPLYLYAGQGDWETARTLWQQLIGASREGAGDANGLGRHPTTRPAHRLRLERFAFDGGEPETRLLLESERSRSMSGRASVEVAGEEVAGGEVQGLRVGEPQSVPVRLVLPPGPAPLPVALVFDHQRERERRETAVVRVGVSGTPVDVAAEGDGADTRIRMHNGKLRLTVAPNPLGRLVELSVAGADGAWANQLHVADPGPDAFVWFNPWYGGVHPTVYAGGGWGHPGRLAEERFTWERAAVMGNQGPQWHGVALSTLAQSRQLAGLHLTVSYLLVGGGNVVAAVERLENRSAGRLTGELNLSTFLQPGGDRRAATLYFEREGRLRHQRRVHGGSWGGSASWCALVSPAGPTVAVVRGRPEGQIELRDMGLEGAHPDAGVSFDLAAGEAQESVTYIVVAGGLDEARDYRVLVDAGLV